MTITLECSESGTHVTEIGGHGDAYLIGRCIDREAQYLVTPETGHVWYDACGARCADLGRIDCPTMPPGDSRLEAFDDWAAAVIVAASEAGVRIE